MDEHVQAQTFLQRDHLVDLPPHTGYVLGVVDLALAQCGASQADRRGLREGADGGGGQQRQVEVSTLLGATFVGRCAFEVGGCQCRQTCPDGGVVQARICAAGLGGVAGGAQFVGDDVGALGQSGGQQPDFVDLFGAEGEPRTQPVVERGFRGQ
ncbi:Uncharacterised protein [Mycobacteroides abscessus subsp. abscessus]|nr:Uncharacterised protein [Mycobacteroides abscessus subsp. abscessus]